MNPLIEMVLIFSSCAVIASIIVFVWTYTTDYKTFKREKHKLILIGIISLCIFLVILLIHSYN